MALKFAPWSSEIELPFYTALTTLKIDYDKLNDGAKTIQGLYELRSEVKPEDSCRMRLLGNAFTSHDVPINHVRAEGKIKNMNTIEDFQNSDKSALLRNAGKQIWDAIDDGTIYQIPSLLASFYVVSFANLKKYNFTYWFAFPALHSDPAWKQVKPVSKLSPEETVTLVESFNTLRFSARRGEHGFFLAKRVWSVARPATPEPATPEEENRPRTPQLSDVLGFEWVCGSIKDFEEGFFNGVAFEDQFVCFIDPSTYEENPGWMLRNYLVLIRRRWKLSKVQILCYRDIHSSRHIPRSLILSLELPEDAPSPESMVMPKVTGWERNPIGKLLPRTTNLSTYMDPRYLADQAVDLNLKLMKWRIVPDLNLDVIKNTKCLLLGAGTLGTFVSRSLMAWGVRKITFVDNATVSFSNPVRQPLFEFEDCLNGGAKKAEQAAAALRKVYPGVNSAGHAMSVPMLGHAITSEATTKADFERLQQLIEEHDAIFLLMDTRESRWLPTLMGKAAGKIVMNAALGFDTYVVMRHGVSPPDGGPAALGCYFCNDVVAPADSVKDQTLDQQCTVTRPGVAPMASSLLVELLVSILQHPQGAHAAAPKPQTPNTDYERDPPSHVLGLVPHQIRGYLATFSNMLISGQSYDCCSACSSKVVEAYRQDGWDFIKRALTEKDYVTELSGLAEVQRQAEAAAGDVEWDSEDELADDGEGEGELL